MATWNKPMTGFGSTAGGPGGLNRTPGSAGPVNNNNAPATHVLDGAPDDTISRLRFSPQGCPMQLLAASSWDKSVRVWRVDTSGTGPGTLFHTPALFMQQSTAPVLDTTLTVDGRCFFGGCCKTAQMWDLQTNQKQQVAAHDLPVSCLAFVPQSSGAPADMLVTGSWDGTVRFWDLRSPTPAKEERFISGAPAAVPPAGGFGAPPAAAAASNARIPVLAMDCSTSPFATFVTGRKIHVYNLTNLTKHTELEPHSMVKFGLRCISNFRNNQGMLLGSSEGRVASIPLQPENAALNCCFKAHTIESTTQRNHFTMYPANFTKMHPTAMHIGFSGGSDGAVRAWNLQTKARVFDLPATMHDGSPIPVSAGDLNADGSLVAFASSYDWSMGKEGKDPTQPRMISILPVNPLWLK